MLLANLLAFGLIPLLLALILGVALLIFEVIMFVHAIRNRGISDERRIVWLLGMLLIHPIVAIVYLFTDYQKAD